MFICHCANHINDHSICLNGDVFLAAKNIYPVGIHRGKECPRYFCGRLARSLKFIFEMHGITFDRVVIRSGDIDRKLDLKKEVSFTTSAKSVPSR